MTNIIAEFHYWDYGKYSGEAMDSRPEVKKEELDRICLEFNVDIKVKKVSASYFSLTRIGFRLPKYDKVIIQVIGEIVEDVEACVCRIFLRYGKPDEVPSHLFGGKRVGRVIIEELLRELWGGKR